MAVSFVSIYIAEPFFPSAPNCHPVWTNQIAACTCSNSSTTSTLPPEFGAKLLQQNLSITNTLVHSVLSFVGRFICIETCNLCMSCLIDWRCPLFGLSTNGGFTVLCNYWWITNRKYPTILYPHWHQTCVAFSLCWTICAVEPCTKLEYQ